MIKFECKGCAGCCHGSISLTLDEAIKRYYRHFPLMGIYSVADVRNVPSEKDKDAYSKAMKKFSKENLSFYAKTKSNRKIIVHPQVVSLNHPELPCVNLDENNFCEIYSFKPKACTLYPFRVDTPVAHMEKGLMRERHRSYEEEQYITCGGWTNTETVIFTTRGPADDSVINLFKSRTSESKITTELFKTYFNHIATNEEIVDKIEAYSELNQQSSNIIQVKMIDMLAYLASKKLVNKLYLDGYAMAQRQQFLDLVAKIESLNNDKFNLIANVAKEHLVMIDAYLEQR